MSMGSQGQKMYGWVFHVIVWAAVLALPFFSLLPGRPIVGGKGYLHFLVMVFSFMVVFYVNWFFLIRKYLYTKRIGCFVLVNLGLWLAMMGLCHLVFRAILPPPVPQEELPSPAWLRPVRFFIGNLTIYAMVAAVSVAVRMTREWYRAENLRTEAELQHLKSQLNPHFLFNTLNNIYSLIQIDQERAQGAVHDLGQLLRYVLYDSAEPTVPVRKEMEFLQDYIALMKIRLPRHADVRVSLPETPSSRGMAPMLFISLVENAFKHGVSNEEASSIDIRIREEEDRLVCDIRNSDHPKANGDRSGSGLGLKNLAQRLEMIYPGRYHFTQTREDGAFVSHLDIPL